ncbi:MAG TPA: SDR family oxidoreductase [Bryobacteraceae bacterium]|jgi:NAD(P)-dependent dehydrogenase (short-subunit alcohol dehydrogenase family)|nr:SDR family oxidoreductase [Bryobacteraceae bacterium]
MIVRDKVVVVTGGARGIGEALVRRFHNEGARAVVAADIDGEGAGSVAADVGGFGMRVDVGREADIQALVAETIARYGQIDLFCSNAGVFIPGGIDAPDADWLKMRDIHLLAHVYAARAVLPGMLARGDGYLLQTVSAAGLLTSLESVVYAVTKHAALGLAEWISMTYGDAGIKVSALCPQGVRTDMLMQDPNNFLVEGSVSVEQVADCVIEGLAAERFLILPHPEVAEYFRRKANDHDRWLRGMRRLRAEVMAKKSTD